LSKHTQESLPHCRSTRRASQHPNGYIKQNGANNPLGDRIDLGGPVNVSGFDVGQNLDGTLSVFAASDNLICHIKQAGKNSDTWAAETPFPV
jgi:hypothetical protein